MSAQLGEEIAIQQTLAASERGDVAAVRYWSERFAGHHGSRIPLMKVPYRNRYAMNTTATTEPRSDFQAVSQTKPRGRFSKDLPRLRPGALAGRAEQAGASLRDLSRDSGLSLKTVCSANDGRPIAPGTYRILNEWLVSHQPLVSLGDLKGDSVEPRGRRKAK